MKRKLPFRKRLRDYLSPATTKYSSGGRRLGHGMRRLRTEPLEERRMLSLTTFVDDTLFDVNGGTLEVGDEVIFAQGEIGETGGLIYGTDAFNSIQSGINATDPGGTVNVATGLYAENVTVNKNLTLDGATGTAADVVIDPVSGDGITLTAGNVTIQDLRITGAADGIRGYGSEGADNLTVDNIELIDNSARGMVLNDVGTINVTNAVVDSNTADGFNLFGSDSSVTITGGSFTDNASGIAMSLVTGDISVSDTTISDNGDEGLLLMNSDNVTIDNVALDGNEWGIYLHSNYGDLNISDTTSDANDKEGLLITGAGRVAIDGGSFSGNRVGISMANVAYDTVEINGVTADNNTNDAGLVASGINAIAIVGGSFSGNAAEGIHVSNVYHDVALSDSTISGNADSGAHFSGIGGDLSAGGTLAIDGNGEAGLYVDDAVSATISGGSFDNGLRSGIQMSNVDAVVVTGGSFSGNANYGILLGLGITTTSINGVTITDTGWSGIQVESGDVTIGTEDGDPLLFSNTLNYNSTAITVMGGDVLVINNLMQENSGGITAAEGVATITQNVIISDPMLGGSGIMVDGAFRNGKARIIDNLITTGGGVLVTGGTAMIQGNDFTGCETALLAINGYGEDEFGNYFETNAVVDAGQLLDGTETDFTGLGISTGGNDFSSFSTPIDPYGAMGGAIYHWNYDDMMLPPEEITGPLGLPPEGTDLTAFGNIWFSTNVTDIETVILHDADDSMLGFVDYTHLADFNITMAADTIDEASSATIMGDFLDDPQAHTIEINWGDGQTDVLTVDQWVFNFEASHVYGDDGDYTINVTLADSQGGTLDGSALVHVLNVDPTIGTINVGTGDEGQLIAFDATATDPGDDTLTYTWDFGDGTGAQVGQNVDHAYADNGDFTVTLTVTDGDGGEAIGIATASVTNVAPTITIEGVPATGAEGVPVDLTVSVVDPGTLDTFTYAWSVTKDGAAYATGSDAAFTFTPDDNAFYAISLTVTDDDGGVGTDTAEIDISNEPPVLDVNNAGVSVDEGSIATNGGTFLDVDLDDVAITASLGTVTQTGTSSGTWDWSFDATDGPYDDVVVITADDGQGGVTTVSFTLSVANVAPTIYHTTFSVEENSPNGTYVDVVPASDPGDDVLTYAIVGGSGAVAFAIDPNTGEITVADEAYLDYEYMTSYDLQVAVTDEDGAMSELTLPVSVINRPSISGVVFLDVNENGAFDGNEPALNNVVIELLDGSGNPILDAVGNPVTAITDGGFYLFEDLAPGTYQVHEIQLTGVDDGAEILGDLGGTIPANDIMQVTLNETDASDYIFSEIGQAVSNGDTADVGFWSSRQGRNLIRAAGNDLAQWLTTNFDNVFGDELDGASGREVSRFFRRELFRQRGFFSRIISSVTADVDFVSLALSTYFTQSDLGGSLGAGYGFNVTDTGISTKVINVGIHGEAFNVDDHTDMTLWQMLQATNTMTDVYDNEDGYVNVYDTNGDGHYSVNEFILSLRAHLVFSDILDAGN